MENKLNYLLKAKEIISASLFIPIEKIPDNGTLDDILPLDSLAFETIVTQLEEIVGHPIDALDLLNLRSINDVAKLLEKEMP